VLPTLIFMNIHVLDQMHSSKNMIPTILARSWLMGTDGTPAGFEYKNGILKLKLKKAKEAETRTIKVKTG